MTTTSEQSSHTPASTGGSPSSSRRQATATHAPATHAPPTSNRPTRGPRRRVGAVAGGLAATAALVAGGLFALRDGDPAAADTDDPTSTTVADAAVTTGPATATVEIRDLVETARLSGDLGYDDAFVVVGRLGGTVTSAIGAGEPVVRGTELYRVDGEPVLALFGESGAWRRLSAGVSAGDDIRQLEENLAALGHDPDAKLTIDETWDSATTAAVKRWQRDLGVADDGVVELGEVVFLPGPGEVRSVPVVRGMGVQDGVEVLRYQTHVDVDQVIGHHDGNVTALAPLGAPVVAGDRLYEVNTDPTYALIADHVVNDRTLKKGVSDGRDIEALETNLVALGFDPDAELTVDRAWDDETTAAVDRWLASLDLDETGTTTPELFQFVEPDSVVIGHLVDVGDEVDEPTAVLDVGRSLRRVSAEVGTDDQDLVAIGDTVEIVLPDGTTSPGSIVEIASSATETGNGESVIALEVSPADPTGLGDLVEAPVRIEIERRRTDAVLAVPTAALVGLVSGGNAVEVVRADGSTQLVAVELGETADGWIEIVAGQLVEGDQVVIPR